jgi:hypothetical protein
MGRVGPRISHVPNARVRVEAAPDFRFWTQESLETNFTPWERVPRMHNIPDSTLPAMPSLFRPHVCRRMNHGGANGIQTQVQVPCLQKAPHERGI